MCHRATGSGGAVRWYPVLGALLLCTTALAQAPASRTTTRPDWRTIGNSAIEAALASPASGPADRVWFSTDGARLYVRTAAGHVFEAADFEKWQPSTASAPAADVNTAGATTPAGTQAVKVAGLNSSRLYAYGQQVFRSDDSGSSWINLTSFQKHSIIGGDMRDVAVSPIDADDVVVANEMGVWRSLDGGASWAGLNETLPNLPGRKLAGLPQGSRGVRLLADGLGAIEWAPGEKQAWRIVSDAASEQDALARRATSQALGASISALVSAGDNIYAGSTDGRLWVSQDRGRTWSLPSAGDRGPVQGLWVDSKDPRTALAALGGVRARVLRTVNSGQFWDDITADLPEGGASGVAADRGTGTVYVATDRGVYFTHADLNAAAPVSNWTALAGLPTAAALDVRLDADGNQLFVAMQGYGVYAALAPHRASSLRLVNAADFSQRAAAPGSLLSVLGGRVREARAGGTSFPILAATDSETQIQVPFSVRAGSLSLALESGQGSLRMALPVESVSPAVFVDRDGTPLVLNADNGVLLDAMNPVRSNGRLQVLATGFGRVRPEWPAGVAGPVENPPKVVAQVRAYLDRAPVEVTRATLAPGYVGLYLIEIQMPAVVNAGPAELYLDADGKDSNRVRVWLEP